MVSLEGHHGGPAAVVTGQGLLVLQRVQPEGKRPMEMEEFLRGHRGLVGSRLPSC